MQSLSQLGMVGTTFRRAGQTQLAHYTLAQDQQQSILRRLAAACGFVEVVYLSTCNRVEWIFVAQTGVDIDTCRRRLYLFFHPTLAEDDVKMRRQAAQALHAFAGEGAAEHLFVVAASLDSMVPGEVQILGQVKAALRRAESWQQVGPKLRPVFEEAFAAAKRVRADTRLGQGVVSMLSLALEVVEKKLSQKGAPHTLAVVGVGEMAHQCGAAWQARTDVQLVFVNRTLARADALAHRYGGRAMSLQKFLLAPPTLSVLVTATAAPKPLFDATFFVRCPQPFDVVDLAVLRDVEPQAAKAAGVTLYDIDRLEELARVNRQARNGQMAQARALIDETLTSFRRRLLAREMSPATQALRAHYASTLQTSLTELFARELHDASQDTQAHIALWARRLVNKLAHMPTDGLKQVGYTHGSEVVHTFLQAISRSTPTSTAVTTSDKGDASA